MAKWKRVHVGDVLKDKEDESRFYIKVTEEINLKKGDYLNLESKENRIASITKAFENGKVSEETFNDIIDKINNTPDFVLFNVVKLTKTD